MQKYKQIALEFTQALVDGNFDQAYAMTTAEFQKRESLESLKKNFLRMTVEQDFQISGSIEVGTTEDASKFKYAKPGDAMFIYVSIPGDLWSEAVSVIVNDSEKISSVEFGRP